MVHTHNHGLSSAEEVVTEVVNSHTQSRSRFKMATPSTVSVTLSSLMKKYQLKEEDLDKQVTDEHLDDIASSHCTKWRSLPSRLGMETVPLMRLPTLPVSLMTCQYTLTNPNRSPALGPPLALAPY